MKTQATDQLPEIEWETYSLMDHDQEERSRTYEAKGTDKDGKVYSGTALFVCGEFEKMEDIELESQFCAICGDNGPTKCTPQANCLNVPLYNALNPTPNGK